MGVPNQAAAVEVARTRTSNRESVAHTRALVPCKQVLRSYLPLYCAREARPAEFAAPFVAPVARLDYSFPLLYLLLLSIARTTTTTNCGRRLNCAGERVWAQTLQASGAGRRVQTRTCFGGRRQLLPCLSTGRNDAVGQRATSRSDGSRRRSERPLARHLVSIFG